MNRQDSAASAPTLLDSAMLIPLRGGGCARVVNRLRARNVKEAPGNVQRWWRWWRRREPRRNFTSLPPLDL